jgi:hypothetical protein
MLLVSWRCASVFVCSSVLSPRALSCYGLISHTCSPNGAGAGCNSSQHLSANAPEDSVPKAVGVGLLLTWTYELRAHCKKLRRFPEFIF